MDWATKKIMITIKFEDNRLYKPVGFCNINNGIIVEKGDMCYVYSIQTEKATFVRDYKALGTNLEVTGIKQLKSDLKSYEIYYVRIKSNCSGKENEYTFGPQKIYLE